MSERIREHVCDVVERLGMTGELASERRHERRKHLWHFWQQTKTRGGFLAIALDYADQVAQKGTEFCVYQRVLSELSGDRAEANRKISRCVLFVMLSHAIAECTDDREDWREMECAARSRLVDEEVLQREVKHYVREILGLEPRIGAEVELINRLLQEEEEALKKRVGDPDVFFERAISIGAGFLESAASHEKVASCIEEISDYVGNEDSARKVLCLYLFYFAMEKCVSEDPLHGSLDHLRLSTLCEIMSCF